MPLATTKSQEERLARRAEIWKLHNEGHSYREIGEKLGLTSGTITYYLKSGKDFVPKPGRRSGIPRQSPLKSKILRDPKVTALAMKAQGLKETMPMSEVAKKLGMTKSRANYLVYGINKDGSTKPAYYRQKGQTVPKPAVVSKPGRPRGVVSVLGATTTSNGVAHHEWFIAGYLTRYAQEHDLDVKGLVGDVKTVIEGGK